MAFHFSCPAMIASASSAVVPSAVSSAPSKCVASTSTARERHPIERGELHPLRDVCDLTASDVPVLFGFGYESLNELVQRKRTGSRERYVSLFVKELCERGHALEQPSCEWLDRKLGRQHAVADFYTLKMDIDGVPAIFGASPDAIYDDSQGTLLVEIKNPLNETDMGPHHLNERQRQKWWQYWIQVQFQLHVSGLDSAVLCVWHPTLRPRTWDIRRIPEWWDQAFVPAFRRLRAYLRPGLGAVPVPRFERGYREAVYAWSDHI